MKNLFGKIILGILFCVPALTFGRPQPVEKSAERVQLFSPDKQTHFVLSLDQGQQMTYSVSNSGKIVIKNGTLGLVIDGRSIGENVRLLGTSESHKNESFAWPLGENDSVSNIYNQMIINLQNRDLKFGLIIRAFNGSIAFRYFIPEQPGFKGGKINEELTSFGFVDPLTLYQYNQESIYRPMEIDSLRKSSDLPTTLTNNKDIYVSVGEADNEDYTKGELVRNAEKNSLKISFLHDSSVEIGSAFQSPWRTISISKTGIGLHQFADLNLRLVDPGTHSDPHSVRPGKLFRAQLNTDNGLRSVDFAAAHDFQYVLFDAGWYGKEFNSTSDPRTYIDELNLPRVIEHGKSKGIGIILYVNYVGLKQYLDQILPLYKEWGVAGIKFGFVDGLTQSGIEWLRSAVKKATDAGFIIDVHDNYKPTGWSRKYPGFLTQEGIRGNENSPDAFHNTVLPFTRFLAGPADYTFCYPNSKQSFGDKLKVSKGQQLALTVAYFSPLQAIFWYGKAEDYTNEGEIEFFKYVPTVWNESHYLKGEIGKYISVARRQGQTWFIGNVAGLEDWNDSIILGFLDAGKNYEATIYEDDSEKSIRKRVLRVKKGDTFSFQIKASGGQALIVRPVK